MLEDLKFGPSGNQVYLRKIDRALAVANGPVANKFAERRRCYHRVGKNHEVGTEGDRLCLP